MEMEALESLFPIEMKRESDTEFSLIGLVPFTDNSQKNHVSVDLRFRFPKGYPTDESVSFTVLKTTGCIATDSSRLDDLTAVIDEVCIENSGSCCVYQIADRVQEWLRDHNEEEKSLHDQLTFSGTGTAPRRRAPVQRAAASDDDESDFDSDDFDSEDYDSDDYSDDDSDDDGSEEADDDYEGLVTKELVPENQRVKRGEFLEWKLQYDQYLLKNGLIKRMAEGDVRRTGRQEFLDTLTARGDKGGSGTATAATAALEFNEELFGDEQDVDLDEESAEE